MLIKQALSPSSIPRRRTKIVATVGPASRSEEMLSTLVEAGVNVFRLNFSHGTHQEHLETLQRIRSVASRLNSPIAVLQDLSGPKIRISNIQGDYVAIEDGATIEIRKSKGALSDNKTIYVEGLDPAEFTAAGQTVLLADGIISLDILSVSKDYITCVAQKGGRLRSRVGIAFPESAINLPATTEKDLVDLMWGIEHVVDYVAISFVQNAADVINLRKVITDNGGDIKIIAKIERRRALENIEEIADTADGLMVARGDLGLEVPLEKLPSLQQGLIEMGNHRGIPVIVATQMLHSMITAVRPTRAEASDIAAAVMSGADAVMLSEETAIGEHPREAVRYLSLIAQEAEKHFEFEEYKLRLRDADRETVPDAVSYAACAAAVKVQASAIIACTDTGSSARLVAKYRPQQPLYGVTTKDKTARRLALYWGVIPLKIDSTTSRLEEVDAALRVLKRKENLTTGSRAIITGGALSQKPGSTSIMEIRELE